MKNKLLYRLLFGEPQTPTKDNKALNDAIKRLDRLEIEVEMLKCPAKYKTGQKVFKDWIVTKAEFDKVLPEGLFDGYPPRHIAEAYMVWTWVYTVVNTKTGTIRTFDQLTETPPKP
jgi:tetrahydromethanopterin S-methyltransferase subunit G